MKLITEYINQDLEILTEASASGGKTMSIEGVFAQAETKNRNGRIYGKNIMENAVNKYTVEQVKTGRAVGELNHPTGPTINLDKVSHRIVNLEWNNNDVVGKATILNTPCGDIVRGLLEGGVKLGVSTRGMGSLEQREGVNYVKDDFILNTVDIVQDPSAHAAFVNGIMEGVDYFYNKNNGLYEKSTELREKLSKMTIAEIGDNQLKEFKDYLNGII